MTKPEPSAPRCKCYVVIHEGYQLVPQHGPNCPFFKPEPSAPLDVGARAHRCDCDWCPSNAEPASPPTDVDRRLDEVRARAEPYEPTDEEEPTCARCRAEVETEGEDWDDGDLCLECEALERNEAVADRAFLLALVDELRRR